MREVTLAPAGSELRCRWGGVASQIIKPRCMCGGEDFDDSLYVCCWTEGGRETISVIVGCMGEVIVL